MLGVLRIS